MYHQSRHDPTNYQHLNHSWSWRSPSIYGNGPPGRSYHSATVVGGHKVVYFGGNDGNRCYNRVHVLQVGPSVRVLFVFFFNFFFLKCMYVYACMCVYIIGLSPRTDSTHVGLWEPPYTAHRHVPAQNTQKHINNTNTPKTHDPALSQT